MVKIEKGDYISMTVNIATIKQQLLAKQAELQENIGSLTEAHPTPVGAIEASDGPQDFEEVAVDFLETQQEQSLEVNSRALLPRCRLLCNVLLMAHMANVSFAVNLYLRNAWKPFHGQRAV